MKKINESIYKLERKLTTCTATLKLEPDTHIPDLMTRIRILPAIAVVAQNKKVARFFDGDDRLEVSIKFLPRTEEVYKNLKELGGSIKKLPGVKTIAFDTYNKRTVTLKGKKIIF